MIPVKEVEQIHKLLINAFGGSHGIRDSSALESALTRPFQTFEERELYPTLVGKAASLMESILVNHPFIDGNKRTGFLLCESILEKDGFTINADTDSIYEFIVNIANGDLHFDDIVNWLKSNTSVI